ncbi:MAG: hypothetical protein M1426_05090 [Patescibacteria group bacterium]|nr:hypothetical protein [Patescibacteria group bacterium]
MPDIFVAETKPKKGKTETPLPRIETKDSLPPKPVHKKMGFLRAFAEKPHGVTFANQKAHEEVILFLRAHLITNFLWFVIFIFLLFIPLFYFIIFKNFPSPLAFIPERFAYFLVVFYYLLVFAYALFNFLNWFYNILLITNLGVIDIDYSDLLYHDVAFTNFNLVEDVNYTKTGFFRSLFNYGDIFIQTAGGRENLEGLGVPNPARAAHIISDSIGKGDGSG